MYLNICKMHQPICKGRCCDDTVVFNREQTPTLPAEIKKQLPMVNLIKPATTNVDGKEYHGWRFSCNNFDKETLLCKDFENRPDMCRWYLCREAIDILSLVSEPNSPW